MALNNRGKSKHYRQAQKIGEVVPEECRKAIGLKPKQKPENKVGKQAGQENRVSEELVG